MKTVTQSAWGMTAFTQTNDSILSPLAETGPVVSLNQDAPARSWGPLLNELRRICGLDDDWDGEGTEAPAAALIDGAISLALALDARGTLPADRVIVGVNGTIYFEWHTPLGYQEIEVTSPLDAECRWVRKGSDVAEVVCLTRCSQLPSKP